MPAYSGPKLDVVPARKQKLLYIAHFDPTEVASGTCARGRAMLRALEPHFDITLVCFSGQFEEHPEKAAICAQIKRIPVPFSSLGYYGISLSLYRAARQAVEESRPDVILA